MKLFVVLLALRLTAAEKLNRRYLPPQGAKFAGGRSDDLQTPLEYPKETPTYGKGEYGSTVYAADDTDIVKIGTPDEFSLSSMVSNGPYYKSFPHLRSGFDPGHMPIIAVPESIDQNYQPQLFGMYGGSPMSIKNIDYNIDMAGSDDLIISDENIKFPEGKVEPEVRSLQNIQIKQAEQYQPTRPGANTGAVTTLRDNGQNLSFKKIERPQANKDRSAIVLNYENVQNPGGYFYNFDTSNGIHRDESATTTNGVKAKGSYSYKGDDGKVYTVTYTADENGFQPTGDHLPPIPEAIQNVIEQAKKDKDAGIIDDGSYDETKYGHMKYQGPVHRYMQKNAKTHKRKKVSGEQKILAPSNNLKYNTNTIMRSKSENMQSKENNSEKPFGMKIVQLFDNSRDEENAMYIQSPKTKENQDIMLENSQKINNIKVMPNSMDLQNIQRNRGILNSNTEKNFEVPTIQDGYFYVPPKNVFVDGKYQDKPTYTNINNKSVLVTELNIDDYRSDYGKFSDKQLSDLQMTQLIISTEKPLFQQTYDSDLYVNTNADVDQSIDNTRPTSKASTSKKSDTDTTKQFYSNTPSTKPYYNEFTMEIVQEEETVIPENGKATDFWSAQNDFTRANYESTTPMSLETRYTIQTYGNTNQYETISSESTLTTSNFDVDYSENEGYFKTTPEKPATFEDVPSSTNSPYIYTIDGMVNKESTTGIKEDEFGRTRQDSFGITDSSMDSFTNGVQSDTESKPSTPYDDYEETLRTDKPTTLDNKSITQFPSEFIADVNKTPDDLHPGRDEIIGEDFSGPKQPQRYDPKNGYYY